MHNRLVAGVDCSTQSTKVIVVDVDNGEIKASGQVEHDVFALVQQAKQILRTGGVLWLVHFPKPVALSRLKQSQ